MTLRPLISALLLRVNVSELARLGVIGYDHLCTRRQTLLEHVQFLGLNPALIGEFDLEVNDKHTLGERVFVMWHALAEYTLRVIMLDHFA